jgi:CheY-like chemotaxis protein
MRVLFVDDDADDVELFREAVGFLNGSEIIQQNTSLVECETVDDGQKALSFLASAHQLPDMIFLDINMPVMDGRTCLSTLKRDERLAKIPVVMFSTAYRDNDHVDLQTMGAQECLRKPNGFKDLVKMLGQVLYKKLL